MAKFGDKINSVRLDKTLTWEAPNFQPSPQLDARRSPFLALVSQINSQFSEFDKFWLIFGLLLQINVTVQQTKKII
jgi:hypothetical protein